MFLIKSLRSLKFSSGVIVKHNIRDCSTNGIQECINSNPLIQEQYDVSQKLLRVAIIGMPNAGKSTLINYLMDRKVCPTSAKVHTTRKKSQAIFTEGDAQIVFVDTPGLVTDRIKKRFNLENSFIKDSDASLQHADIVGIIHDVSSLSKREHLDIKIVELLEKYKKKRSFLVLNKIDLLKSKRKLLELTRLLTMSCLDGIPIAKPALQLNKLADNKGWPYFKEVFMVSALTGDGINRIKDYLIQNAKPGKWQFPAGVWSNQTPEKIIVDTVKATLLDFLPQEIPYQMEPILEFYEVNEEEAINTIVKVKCISERVARLVAGASNGRLRQIIQSTQRDLCDTFNTFVKINIVLEPPKENKQK